MGKVDLKIDWATHEAAKYACEHWHYSKCIPKSKMAKFGVWEKGVFVGVVIYGVGATADLVKRYGLKPEQGCELVRVALKKHESAVTRIIAVTLRLLKKEYPGLRLVVSFADPENGHVGGIYQGGGWAYTGATESSNEYLYRGVRWHGRAFRHKYKGMEKHPDVKIVTGSSKYRYLMPLDPEIKQQIEHLRKPYPKRAPSIDSDAPGVHPGEVCAGPTDALHNKDL